jgi:voltage-gated potassium channel Kch
MEENPQQRPGAERATDNYGPIFLLLLAVFVFAMFTVDSTWIRVPVSIAVIVVFLATLRATGVTERGMRRAMAFSAVLTLAAGGSGFSDSALVKAAVSLAAATALGASVLLLVRRIFEMDRIRPREVVGGLTAYTQIALGFSFLYAAAAVLTDGDFFNNGIAGTTSDFLYFSVVTVTTLGYGDLSPATDVGRSLVILETLLGQIFLIVLVAFLVGMLGKKPRETGSDTRTRERRAGK